MKAVPLIITTVLIISLFPNPSAARVRNGKHLHVGFYNRTCPQAEEIINKAVAHSVQLNPGIAAGLIRLHFHDCFVNGCDASVLLDVTPSEEAVEKVAPGNLGLRGMEVIDQAKARLENECPGIVSCADTLAFAARDAAVLSGIPNYRVPAGRRDGRSSRAFDTFLNLPPPTSSVDGLTEMFAKKGLDQEDMVTLSGAHSIGVAHCSSFDYRVHNFNENQFQDPNINQLFASYLRLVCPRAGSLFGTFLNGTKLQLDSFSPTTLDNMYYVGLKARKGLLGSDQVLIDDPRTSKTVEWMASNPRGWSIKFGKAMVRMGRIGVLTGTKGEIRSYCRLVN